MDTIAERVRIRLREEMARRHLSQRDVAHLLAWSQSRVAKLLSGRVGLDLDDAAALCFALDLPLVEAVRDRGMEFFAEMTPMELRILQRLRAVPTPIREAILTLLDVQHRPEVRGATRPKPPIPPLRPVRKDTGA